MIPGWKPKRQLIDQKPAEAPYFLASEDIFIRAADREIFVKHIFSTAECLPKYGPVIMAPGICTNANIFRMDEKGSCLDLRHNRSFANLLASEGFDVYLYHPGYSDRVHNRYVSQHCPQSIYYQKRYRVPPDFSYGDMVNTEVPAVIDFVCRHSRSKTVSWIGYSLGGMIAYSYMSKNPVNPVKNLITIGSPMALNQIFFRFVPFINFTSRILGVEEDTVLGNLSHNMVPLTRAIRALPDWFVRFNLITPYLCNPMNITNATMRAVLGHIVEPMPKALQKFFSRFVPFINFTSRILGVEEDTVLGNLSHNMVPLTRAIRALPDWFVRFNLITPYLCNPMNITNATMRAVLGHIVEPMPKALQKFFSRFVQQGYSSQERITLYLNQLRRIRKTRKNFLFFYATADLIATPESVFLAREVIAPHDPYNLVGIPSTGHVDLIVGKNASEKLWRPSTEWLLNRHRSN